MHKLVEQLTSAYAVSGDERRLHEILRGALTDIADDIHDTPLGNLIAVRRGHSSEHAILFAAHLDEVGAWVTRINERVSGYLLQVNRPARLAGAAGRCAWNAAVARHHWTQAGPCHDPRRNGETGCCR